MYDVRQLAREIVAREGGYVNDPDDPGGPTKYGVTLATLRRWRGRADLTAEDVRALTEAEATEIFLADYYHKPGLDLLPECLRASVFDMLVNAGGNAVEILQRLLNRLGAALSVDGHCGPRTCAEAMRAAGRHPDLADLYGLARRDYYFALADRREASRKYVRTQAGGKGGWIKRAEEFLSPELHLTEAEFATRCAVWRGGPMPPVRGPGDPLPSTDNTIPQTAPRGAVSFLAALAALFRKDQT